ncbi:MAG: excinuclease ABC subunit UvrB [Clostridiales bacterium]|nr:excinuclease ABC subunit UvrB [Clostridiales bacterium]
MDKFNLVSKFKPTGDQPKAINTLVEGLNDGLDSQVLLGVTGSGKTFTMANIIAKVNRPTLVLAHNKTLAAQLYSEFKEFFPENAVEYFVSFYDYYQPEAYIPQTDTYIEKDSSINEEIEKLRHSATCSLQERRDVIVVASVSSIYGLGDPKAYSEMAVSLRPNMQIERNELLKCLVALQYERNDTDFARGTFRVRGDVVEIITAQRSDKAVRVEFFGDEIDKISEIEVVTGRTLASLKHAAIFPNTHYAADNQQIINAIKQIEIDLEKRLVEFDKMNKPLEKERLEQRTRYDIEMLQEIGYCSGIENYSRYLDGRKEGQRPYTLLDYFPDDFLTIIDESHVTIPQLRAMYAGDRSRKEMLVNFGFRLPAAFDNRPLKFEETQNLLGQKIFVSATPADFELELAGGQIAEQIIRPTGLLDPEIQVKPTKHQIDDLIEEIEKTTKKGYRTLVTTLTKRMAEMLTSYLKDAGLKVEYMHSEIHTLDRVEILRNLRLNKFDVLVGINLLREGLDLPEVALIAILDADKEGFLRSQRSLIQTIGRGARNAEGRVIMYADNMTDSMKAAIEETRRRRKIQDEYNKKHGIIPKTIIKPIADLIEITGKTKEEIKAQGDIKEQIRFLEEEMLRLAKNLEFEKAAKIRDTLKVLYGENE